MMKDIITPKVLSYNEGIEYIFDNINNNSKNTTPYIVSIHGVPNSGKTHFRKEVFNKLNQTTNLIGRMGMVDDSLNKILARNDMSDYIILEEMIYVERAKMYAIETFGKPIDLKVYIAQKFDYNSPLWLKKYVSENHEICIENLFAKNKFN